MSIMKNRRTLILLLLLMLAACSSPSTGPDISNSVDDAPVVEPILEAPTLAAEDTDTVAPTLESEATNDTLEPISESESEEGEETADITRPANWSEETHSNDVDPNYDIVFAQEQVNSMTITITPEAWQAMLDNMTDLYGEPNGNGNAGGGGQRGEGQPPAGEERVEGERPARAEGGGRGQGGGGQGGGENFATENPDYVAASIAFEGNLWTNVGVRFKGNSTLTRAWNSGSLEMPFKLDFDEFEDDYPEIDNQRFYGFKQLSLQSPSADESYVRAPLAYNVMQDVGLIAPETAWYELFVDYGEGPVSFGLYTVIEVIDDTVIEAALGDDDGNIYEGDGTGVSLAEGTFDLIADSFEKENNSKSDYNDLEALYNVLHAETRLTNSDQWRTDLEAVFDVNTFLKWLAVNTVIVNWDTYGQMTHNFYIYNNPDTDLLTWIGWDYNESFQDGRRGGNASLSQQEETDDWPLIRYLLDEPVYYDQYVDYITEIASDAVATETIAKQLQAWETMLTPYVANSATFTNQIDTITNFVAERNSAVETFLNAPSN